MKNIFLISTFLFSCAIFSSEKYPTGWWKKFPETDRQGTWEILPHEARPGEVVLSKKTELGIFSNLAYSEFVFENKKYASIEGLWQMMKFPDPQIPDDIRNSKKYSGTREEIALLSGFKAKDAGKEANAIMKELNIDWISYQGKKFNYKDYAGGSEYHLKIMTAAIREKVMQNTAIKELLIKTKGLKLVPDHDQGANPPAAYLYHQILMDLRDSEL